MSRATPRRSLRNSDSASKYCTCTPSSHSWCCTIDDDSPAQSVRLLACMTASATPRLNAGAALSTAQHAFLAKTTRRALLLALDLALSSVLASAVVATAIACSSVCGVTATSTCIGAASALLSVATSALAGTHTIVVTPADASGTTLPSMFDWNLGNAGMGGMDLSSPPSP